jgi:hypothetical protein
MKKIYSTILFSFFVLAVSAQSGLSLQYSLGLPEGDMNKNINAVHSFNAGYQYTFPWLKDRIMLGGELGIGAYANTSKMQDLRFPDGTGTTTMVHYNSNVFNSALFTKVKLFEDTRLNPYLSFKGGYSLFFSNITVDDPEDPDDCAVLEHKNLMQDHSFYVAYGGGVLIDLASYKRKHARGLSYVDISINKTRGNNLDYINTKHLQSHNHSDPNNPPPIGDGKSEPLNIRFINLNSQVVHEHQVAEVYNSPLRLLDIRIGVVFGF